MFLKDYLGNILKGKKVNFKCDCILNINITGVVVDYIIKNNEIIWTVSNNNKLITIGENTPRLQIEIL